MRILVVDDHPIVVNGISTLLRDEGGGPTLIQATSVAEGEQLFMEGNHDVVVIDVNLPDGSGLVLLSRLFKARSKIKALVFSVCNDPLMASIALEAGALGYVCKSEDPALLRDAIIAVAAGRVWLSDRLKQDVALIRARQDGSVLSLSAREMSVLRGLAYGDSLSEISDTLNVSYKTIATECSNLREKLGARTHPELVRIAMNIQIVN